MSAVTAVEASLEQLPLLLTVEEAAGVLWIGRTLAYDLARHYEASAGGDGLPVARRRWLSAGADVGAWRVGLDRTGRTPRPHG